MRKGFTLVEALVTLGIIGTIAAITIPSVVNDVYERETIAKARKIYSVLNQGMHNAINTSDLNFTLYCGQTPAPAFANFQNDFELNQVFNISGSIAMTDIGNGVLLKSGEAFFVTLNNKDANSNCGTITADINGNDTPNQAGADRFVFNLSCKGEVVPAGTSHDVIVNGVLPD